MLTNEKLYVLTCFTYRRSRNIFKPYYVMSSKLDFIDLFHSTDPIWAFDRPSRGVCVWTCWLFASCRFGHVRTITTCMEKTWNRFTTIKRDFVITCRFVIVFQSIEWISITLRGNILRETLLGHDVRFKKTSIDINHAIRTNTLVEKVAFSLVVMVVALLSSRLYATRNRFFAV